VLAVFVVIALIVLNLRWSTTGLALDAVRWSPTAARALGVSVVQMKVLVAGFAVFAAGIGGALLATSTGTAIPGKYSTLAGLIWLAVLATLGIRSSVAALIAGLAPLVVNSMFEHLEQVNQSGITILLIEQFVHRALALADQCAILVRGRLGWAGTAAEAGHEVLDRYLGENEELPTRQP
jgi:ABC-type branched-subunit amino acid transport system permease subunit